jgi:WD40 repeat protein
MQWSLVMRADGARLYAINGATGVIAEVDTTNQFSPQILRTGHITLSPAGAIGAGTAAISPDGSTLVAASSSGLVWVKTATLRPFMSSLSGWHLWSLALSPDGKVLYVVSDQGRVAQVSMSSAAILAEFDTSEGKPMSLMRVAAA